MLINNDTHQRETLSERPIRPPLTLFYSLCVLCHNFLFAFLMQLAHVTDANNRLKRQSLHSIPQLGDKQYKEVLTDKAELEQAIKKYTITMADQADEVQRLHKKCKQLAADKTELQEKLDQAEKVTQTKTEDFEKECRRLENMVSKQSRAIASQNEKARKDKQTLVDLMREKEMLAEELHRLKTDNHGNGDEGSISKAKYDEVMEENKSLRETISSQAGTLQGSQGDRDRLEFLTKENWRLQGALRRQEDAMSKKHAEVKRYKKLAQAQGGSSVEDFAKHLEELDAENLKLQEELDQCKEDLLSKEEDAKKFDQLQSENERLKDEASKQKLKHSETEAEKKRYNVILKENIKLKEELEKQKGTKLENGVEGNDVNKLQKEVDDLNSKLEETVRVYRGHLLSAVQVSYIIVIIELCRLTIMIAVVCNVCGFCRGCNVQVIIINLSSGNQQSHVFLIRYFASWPISANLSALDSDLSPNSFPVYSLVERDRLSQVKCLSPNAKHGKHWSKVHWKLLTTFHL